VLEEAELAGRLAVIAHDEPPAAIASPSTGLDGVDEPAPRARSALRIFFGVAIVDARRLARPARVERLTDMMLPRPATILWSESAALSEVFLARQARASIAGIERVAERLGSERAAAAAPGSRVAAREQSSSIRSGGDR